MDSKIIMRTDLSAVFSVDIRHVEDYRSLHD